MRWPTDDPERRVDEPPSAVEDSLRFIWANVPVRFSLSPPPPAASLSAAWFLLLWPEAASSLRSKAFSTAAWAVSCFSSSSSMLTLGRCSTCVRVRVGVRVRAGVRAGVEVRGRVRG